MTSPGERLQLRPRMSSDTFKALDKRSTVFFLLILTGNDGRAVKLITTSYFKAAVSYFITTAALLLSAVRVQSRSSPTSELMETYR